MLTVKQYRILNVQYLKETGMKKLKVFLPAASLFIFFVFALSACRKHTCQCTAYSGGNNPGHGGYTTFTVKGSPAKKKKYCTDRSTKPDKDGNYTQCIIIN